MFLLRVRPAAQDQFGGDFGPRTQRADANIAPAEFLGHHAHGGLAHAQAAMLLGDRQAEDAQFRHFVDDVDRDQLVAQVPAVSVRHDPLVCPAAELVADHLILFVQPGRTETGRPLALGHQRGKAGPGGLRVPFLRQPLHRIGHQDPLVLLAQPDVLGPADLALAHRDAAVHLPEVFAEPDLQDQALDLAELPGLGQSFGPGV